MSMRWEVTDAQLLRETCVPRSPIMEELKRRGMVVAQRARGRVKYATGNLQRAIAAREEVDTIGPKVITGVILYGVKYALVQEFDPVRGRPYLRPSLSNANLGDFAMRFRIARTHINNRREREYRAARHVVRALYRGHTAQVARTQRRMETMRRRERKALTAFSRRGYNTRRGRR